MKNTVISALLVLFVLFNGYLLYKTVYQQIRLTRLERKNSDLVVSNANYEEINHYLGYILRKNQEATYKPLVMNQRISSFLASQPKDSYILVRYDVNICSTCLVKFFNWLNELIKRAGSDNVILFQIGESDHPDIAAAMPKRCRIVPIKADELYSEEYPQTETPYTLVYKKGEKYPFLFAMYPDDIIGMNEMYWDNFVSYIRNTATFESDVELCDTTFFIRDAVEIWADYKTDVQLEKGDSLLLPNGRMVVIRSTIPKGASLRYPHYEYSKGNCCDKDFLKQEYRFP